MHSIYEAIVTMSSLCITALLIIFCCIFPLLIKMCAVKLSSVVLQWPQPVCLCISWLHQKAEWLSCPVWICVSTFSDIQTVMEWLCGGVLQTRSPVSHSCWHNDRIRNRLWTFCLLFLAQHTDLHGGFEPHARTVKSPCSCSQSRKGPHLLAEQNTSQALRWILFVKAQSRAVLTGTHSLHC